MGASIITPNQVFVNRGDPASVDFAVGAFTKDGVQHALDLSSIIPIGAKAVLLRVVVNHNATTGVGIQIGKNGDTNLQTWPYARTQVVGVSNTHNIICALDANRNIGYIADASASFTILSLSVQGWWI